MDPSIQSTDQPLDLTDRITRTSKYCTAGGGFGDVWQCRLHTDANQVMVAIKVIRPQNNGVDEKALRRELGMWKRLHHANILPLLGIARDFGVYISMVSPWLENGSLTVYLRTHKDLSLSGRHRLLEDITSGLHYLHSVSMVHGDLTPNNVLLNNEKRAVLTDFGLSSMLLGQGYTYLRRSCAQPGSIRYTAPELLDPDAFIPPDIRSDVYSFGCLALYVLSGHEPWPDAKNEKSIILSVATGRTPQRPVNNPILDAHWDLIQQCFSPLDASPPRPTTDEILTFLEKFQLEVVLETQFSGQSDSPAPPSDKKGKKRAITESDVESTRPWRRAHHWPIQESMYSTRIKSDGDAGVKEIVFSSDGERMAVVCHDRTTRMRSAVNRVETARLAQSSAIVSVLSSASHASTTKPLKFILNGNSSPPRDSYESDGEITTTKNVWRNNIYTVLTSLLANMRLGSARGILPPLRNKGPTKGPAPKLHWQLLPYDPVRPKPFLHFDVAFHTRSIEFRQNSSHGVQRTRLSDVDLDKPAANEKLVKMSINFQRGPFEWDINVKRDEGIRVRDVLEAIYAVFNEPLTTYEKNLIPYHRRAAYEEAFKLRCKLVQGLPIIEQRQGWKRVDTLLHETLFRGLTQPKSGKGDFILNLSGSAPRDKMQPGTHGV